MKSYTAAETIQATPEKIWEILTDAGGYSEWDNGINTVEGSIATDAHITLHPTGQAQAHDVTVTDLSPGRRMVWTEGMPMGLFRDTRTFRLLSEVSGTTRLSISEEVSGPLTMLKRKRLNDLQGQLDHFAAGLKEAAEAA